MYNGIGLQTARGSGTNGYVQANKANLLLSKKRVAYNSEADIKRAEAELLRKPDPELLEHMKKRQIELRCADFELLMENKGFDEVEIEKKVTEYRKLLQSQLDAGTLDFDVSGNNRDTHARAKAALENRDRMRAAFGISDAFIDGSSFEKINKKGDALPIQKNEDVSAKETKKKSKVALSSSSSSSSSSDTTESYDSSDETDSSLVTSGSNDSNSSSDSDSESSESESSESSEEERGHGKKSRETNVKRERANDKRDRVRKEARRRHTSSEESSESEDDRKKDKYHGNKSSYDNRGKKRVEEIRSKEHHSGRKYTETTYKKQHLNEVEDTKKGRNDRSKGYRTERDQDEVERHYAKKKVERRSPTKSSKNERAEISRNDEERKVSRRHKEKPEDERKRREPADEAETDFLSAKRGKPDSKKEDIKIRRKHDLHSDSKSVKRH